jgi:colanic acid/amylovoran biosynthesis glycosyltransferase
MTFNSRSRCNFRQARVAPAPEPGQGNRALKVAYIMSRFPKLTETFVLYEMLAVERLGVNVEVYPLLRERAATVHADAVPLVARAHFHPFLSLPILRAQLDYLRRRPGAYCRTWWEVLRGTWGSWNFFIGAIGILPKAVRFAYEMERQGIDHVHAHFANHPAVAALVIHRLTGIPFSFTAHAHDLHVEQRMLDAKVHAARFAVTISEFNRRFMVEECGADCEKIHVIHCGIDPAMRMRERTPGTARPLQIAAISSLFEVKGHRYLIEACRLLKLRGVDFRCRLAGDGPLREKIEQQVTASGLSDRISVLGGLDRAGVLDLLATSDVVAQPSVQTADGKREGIPVALMEAMAAGLPVVASAISGIPELVEDGRNGLLVPPRDPEALGRALEQLARDPDLAARMGAAGRRKVLSDFSQETSAQQLVSLFAGRGRPDAIAQRAAG